MTRLLTILSDKICVPKVRHYLGLPPELTSGQDTRREIGPALFLLIEERKDGVFLNRYDARGECVGDTWHLTVEDARSQADYEYEDRIQGWTEIPEKVDDAVAFGLILAAGSPK